MVTIPQKGDNPKLREIQIGSISQVRGKHPVTNLKQEHLVLASKLPVNSFQKNQGCPAMSHHVPSIAGPPGR